MLYPKNENTRTGHVCGGMMMDSHGEAFLLYLCFHFIFIAPQNMIGLQWENAHHWNKDDDNDDAGDDDVEVKNDDQISKA